MFVFTVMAATDSVQTTSTISMQVWFTLVSSITCSVTVRPVYSAVLLLVLRPVTKEASFLLLKHMLIRLMLLQVLAPLAIGLILFVCHLIAIPVDGCW